jgi:hypothetical protein
MVRGGEEPTSALHLGGGGAALVAGSSVGRSIE